MTEGDILIKVLLQCRKYTALGWCVRLTSLLKSYKQYSVEKVCMTTHACLYSVRVNIIFIVTELTDNVKEQCGETLAAQYVSKWVISYFTMMAVLTYMSPMFKFNILCCIAPNFHNFCNYMIIMKIILWEFLYDGTIKVCHQTSITLSLVLCSTIIVTAFTFAVSRSQWWWWG